MEGRGGRVEYWERGEGGVPGEGGVLGEERIEYWVWGVILWYFNFCRKISQY